MRGVGICHLEEEVSLHPAVALIQGAVCLPGKERETSFETVLIGRRELTKHFYTISFTHMTLIHKQIYSIPPRKFILKMS